VNFELILLGMVAVTFGSRLLGLFLTAPLPPFWSRFIRFVPVAVFAALVTPNLEGSRGEGVERAIAAVICGVLAWRTKQLWIGLFAGMAAFWLLRAVL
jgi:branched-subunit amino acid transport protein